MLKHLTMTDFSIVIFSVLLCMVLLAVDWAAAPACKINLHFNKTFFIEEVMVTATGQHCFWTRRLNSSHNFRPLPHIIQLD